MGKIYSGFQFQSCHNSAMNLTEKFRYSKYLNNITFWCCFSAYRISSTFWLWLTASRNFVTELETHFTHGIGEPSWSWTPWTWLGLPCNQGHKREHAAPRDKDLLPPTVPRGWRAATLEMVRRWQLAVGELCWAPQQLAVFSLSCSCSLIAHSGFDLPAAPRTAWRNKPEIWAKAQLPGLYPPSLNFPLYCHCW